MPLLLTTAIILFKSPEIVMIFKLTSACLLSLVAHSALINLSFSKYDKKILCYEETAKNNDLSNYKSIISTLKPNDKVAIVIGPEGGIDDSEVNYLLEQGFIPCALGPRILRTETAIFYALSTISYEMELKNV